MQKLLFGIFAHPDDEAFGPVGTLLREVKAGTEVHLIVLTAGEGGANPDSHTDLGAVRLQEWHRAGELIGAASLHHFGYTDGTLGNKDHLEITERIMALVQQIVGDRHPETIEFMSIDLNGLTGHIDHIVAGRSACLAFYRLRERGLPMSRVCLACLSHDDMPAMNTGFVFMESGHATNEIGETVDNREFGDTIREIMRCHHTQRADYETVVAMKGDRLGIDHFIVKD